MALLLLIYKQTLFKRVRAMNKYILIFIIYISCFQLAFADSIISLSNRTPASIHDLSVKELQAKLVEYKDDILGKDLPPECNEDAALAIEQATTEVSTPVGENQSELQKAENELEAQIAVTSMTEATNEEPVSAEVVNGEGLGEGNSTEEPKVATTEEAKLATEEKVIEEPLYVFFKSIKRTACGERIYSWDPEKPAEEMQDCRPVRKLGLLELKAAEIMALEVDEKETPEFRLDDPAVRSVHKQGKYLMGELRKYLSDYTIDTYVRFQLLRLYLNTVALPTRDLIMATRAYIKTEYEGEHFYESLLPDVPRDLIPYIAPKDIPEGSVSPRDKMGTWSSGKNINLKVFKFIDRKYGKIKIRYSNQISMRDVLAVLKAPTAKNFLRARKWMTLQMMISQSMLYKAMLEEEGPISVPNSCTTHLNGDLPALIPNENTQKSAAEAITKLLSGHGLLADWENDEFKSYFLDSYDTNPLENGYSGLMPFEQYDQARVGLDKDKPRLTRVDIDDSTYYQTIVDLKTQKLNSVFKKERATFFGLRDKKSYTFEGLDFFQKIIKRGEAGTVYLEGLMEKTESGDPFELVSEQLKEKLQSTKMRISFPSFYTSHYWRQWAIRELLNWAEEAEKRELSLSEKKAIRLSCAGMRKHQFCTTRISHDLNDGEEVKTLKGLTKYLKSLLTNTKYIPTFRKRQEKEKENHNILKRLWSNLRFYTDSLQVAKPTEWDFLQVQVQNQTNPWADARFSYLLAMDQLRIYKHEALLESKSSKTFDRQDVCFQSDISDVMRKISEAARVFKINAPINLQHGNYLLSADEKEYIWQDQIDKTDALLRTKSSSGQEYYKNLSEVAHRTMLDQESAEELVASLPQGIREKHVKEIKEVGKSDVAKYTGFFKELYEAKGDPKKQATLFDKFSAKNGINNAYESKKGFLALDHAYKKPIYTSIIKDMAKSRRQKLSISMEKLCNLEPDDHQEFEQLYHETATSQNRLNTLAGGPAVPQKVLDKIDDKLSSMSDEEWTDLWLGLGAGLLGMAAMLLGGACSLTGVCAPIGVAMMAAGAGALGMQLTLVGREGHRKLKADKIENDVRFMEELGFASTGSSDIVSRNWGWTAFEVVSILPLIGVVARSIKTGMKLSAVTSYMFFRNAGALGWKESWRTAGQAGKTIVSEADTELAMFVLDFKHIGKESLNLLIETGKTIGYRVPKALLSGAAKTLNPKHWKAALEKVNDAKYLFLKGMISPSAYAKRIREISEGLQALVKSMKKETFEYTSSIGARFAVEEVNKKTVEGVSKYFNYKPEGLLNLLNNYAGKLGVAKEVVKNIDEGTTIIGKVPLFIGRVINWGRRLRKSHLVKKADTIEALVEGLELAIKNGDTLESYVAKNLDDLTDVFIHIPFRKRELPYMFLLQGGPHVGGINFGKRIPGLYGLADGLMMKKFFNARSRLIYEDFKAYAREVLGMKIYLASETAHDAYKAFQNAAEDSFQKASEAGQRQIAAQYDHVESELADRIFAEVKHYINDDSFITKAKTYFSKNKLNANFDFFRMSPEARKEVLFYPQNESQKQLGKIIWASINVDRVFNFQELGDVAYKVVRELSDYENATEFDQFVIALKVLAIQRNPGVVDIF
jgi:hypothetical protein